MKKCVICLLSVLLAAASGCQKNQDVIDDIQKDLDTVAVTPVTLSETDIRMVQIAWNEQAKEELPTVRTLTISPEDGGYTVSASTEGIVSTELKGNTLQLTAQNIGKTRLTVTDTVTGQTAVCRVEVYSVIETLTFPYASVSYNIREWDMDSYILKDSAFFYEDQNGKSIPLRAYIVDATLTLFSEGFYLKDEMFQGSDIGYLISFPALAYYAPKGLNDDRGVSQAVTYEAGVWSTAQKNYYHKMQGGYLDYAEMHAADSLAFHGALMRKYIRVNNGYSTSPMPFALVNAGAVNLKAGGNTPSKDMFEVTEAMMYINPLLGYYGLGIELAYDNASKAWYNASSQFLIGQSIYYQFPKN